MSEARPVSIISTPRITIWTAGRPCVGSTNWGRKAKKNKATLGLSTFTTMPSR